MIDAVNHFRLDSRVVSPMRPAKPIRLRFTLLQLCKLTVFSAVVCACVVPAIQFWNAAPKNGGISLGLVVVLECTIMPLVLVPVSVLIVRNGPGKAVLIFSLILASTVTTLGAFVWMSCMILAEHRVGRLPTPMTPLVLTGSVILAMSGAAVYLVRGILKRLRAAGEMRQIRNHSWSPSV